MKRITITLGLGWCLTPAEPRTRHNHSSSITLSGRLCRFGMHCTFRFCGISGRSNVWWPRTCTPAHGCKSACYPTRGSAVGGAAACSPKRGSWFVSRRPLSRRLPGVLSYRDVRFVCEGENTDLFTPQLIVLALAKRTSAQGYAGFYPCPRPSPNYRVIFLKHENIGSLTLKFLVWTLKKVNKGSCKWINRKRGDM